MLFIDADQRGKGVGKALLTRGNAATMSGASWT